MFRYYFDLHTSCLQTLPVLQLAGVLLVYWLHLVYLKSVADKDVISTLGAFQMVWAIIAYVTPAVDIVST